jgi:hypothetical protein
MNRSALLLLLAIGCSSSPKTDADGFVPLFNGKDFTGWKQVNCAPETFRVEDGIIISTGKPTGVMRTERMYENYVIELDWMHMKKGGNAGLFVHSGAFPAKGTPFTKGHEIQVLDGDSPDGVWTGHGDVFSIHGATFEPDRAHPKGWMRCLPSEKRANPFGQWNHYRVTVNDGAIKLEVNGKEVSGGTKCKPRKGYICLESEGSECRFKNIRIKELPSTNPPAEEVAEADQGFKSLYTGLDFRGWKVGSEGPDDWKSRDWRFEGSGKGGVLYTEKKYGSFLMIFDWQAPRKGRPEIRLPFGITTLTGKGEKPGQWHRVEVSVRGRLASVIEDGTEFYSSNAFLNVAGPIGLGASDDAVVFTNVFIKELD